MRKTTIKEEKPSKQLIFSGSMHAVDFEVMYQIKLKRICRGYSQQETAFLLGKDKNYIVAKERLENKKSYTTGEIGRLALILDYDSHSFIPRNFTKEGYNSYIGKEIKEKGKIYHEIRIKEKNGNANKLLFKIQEDDPDVVYFPESEKLQLERLKILLTALYETGYFTGTKTPLQIFLCCSRLLTNYINPRLVEQAINHFIQQKKISKQIEDNEIAYRSAETAIIKSRSKH